jgi:hypothetical protein
MPEKFYEIDVFSEINYDVFIQFMSTKRCIYTGHVSTQKYQQQLTYLGSLDITH